MVITYTVNGCCHIDMHPDARIIKAQMSGYKEASTGGLRILAILKPKQGRKFMSKMRNNNNENATSTTEENTVSFIKKHPAAQSTQEESLSHMAHPHT